MDKNKLSKLTDLGYVVQQCCGLCSHFFAANPASLFGVCGQNAYEHQKHTESKRDLSVVRYGLCFKFSPDEQALAQLHKYADLLEGDEPESRREKCEHYCGECGHGTIASHSTDAWCTQCGKSV